MCDPLQLYVFICLISFLIQIYNTYTIRTFSWIKSHKLHLIISFLFNFILFIIWGRVINSLCKTDNKMISWILIFFPIFMALLTSALFISGVFISKVGKEIEDIF